MLETRDGQLIGTMPPELAHVFTLLDDEHFAPVTALIVRQLDQRQAVSFETLGMAGLHESLAALGKASDAALEAVDLTLSLLLLRVVIQHPIVWVDVAYEEGQFGRYMRKEAFGKVSQLSALSDGLQETMERAIHAFEEHCVAMEGWFNELVPGQTLMENVAGLADLISSGVRDLASRGSVRRMQDAVLRRENLEVVAPLLNGYLTLRIAKEMANLLPQCARRHFELATVCGGYTPSRRAQEFLKRVSRCYMFGFDTECAVMCRSVLDAEFEAQISTDDCIDVLGGGQRRTQSFTLDDRIRVAHTTRRISEHIQDLALQVKLAGNRAVHNKPESPSDSLLLIKQTVEVLTVLTDGSVSAT